MIKASLKKVVWFAAFSVMAHGAAAQSRTWNVCGGNVFNTCASVILNVINSTTLEVRVQNLSGTSGTNTFANTVFTAVGFDNLAVTALTPNGTGGNKWGTTTMSGPSISGQGAPSPWEVRNNKVVGGGLQLDLVGTTSNGVASGIASNCAQAGQLPGQSLWASYTGCGGGYTIANQGTNSGWVVFSFSTQAQSLTQANLNNATLLVKGQNGPQGLSTEMICAPGECQPTTTQVTPEPMSLALVGTGLIGLVAIRRRRRPQVGGETES